MLNFQTGLFWPHPSLPESQNVLRGKPTTENMCSVSPFRVKSLACYLQQILDCFSFPFAEKVGQMLWLWCFCLPPSLRPSFLFLSLSCISSCASHGTSFCCKTSQGRVSPQGFAMGKPCGGFAIVRDRMVAAQRCVAGHLAVLRCSWKRGPGGGYIDGEPGAQAEHGHICHLTFMSFVWK